MAESLEDQIARLEEENWLLHQDLERARKGYSFTDQNGIQVHDGQMYGIDQNGDLYDLEPLIPFHPSEY